MLILRRRLLDRVHLVLDGEIIATVTVQDFEGAPNAVKLAFQADADVGIYREELWERMSSEQRSAMRGGNADGVDSQQ